MIYIDCPRAMLVPNESLDIALLFIIRICKLAHLHIHKYSLKFIFYEKSETKQILIYIHFYFQLLFWVTQPLIILK